MRRRRSGIAAWGLAALCLLPLAVLLLLSIAVRWPFPEILPRERQLATWAALLTGESPLAGVFLGSLGLSGLVALVSTAVGYLTAKHLAYHPARDRLLLLAYAPFVMSPVVVGVSLLYLYLRLGLAGSFAGVVLAQAIFGLSFAVVFFTGFWNREKRAMEDLVRTLGGSTFQLYRWVLLPLSKGALALCLFQTFLLSWFQYGLTILIGGGAVETLPMKVYDYVLEANVAYAALASCLLVLPPVLLLWANKRLLWKLV